MLTVVTGPPCSGKTTYVSQHSKSNDVVIDYDSLAQALGSSDPHIHAPHIQRIALAAWSAAVTRALASQDCDVWIIDSFPTVARQDAYARSQARHVRCAADPDELQRRATNRALSP